MLVVQILFPGTHWKKTEQLFSLVDGKMTDFPVSSAEDIEEVKKNKQELEMDMADHQKITASLPGEHSSIQLHLLSTESVL